MSVQSVKKRQYEDRGAAHGPLTGLAAVALFGLAVLLMYIAFAQPQQGTLMRAVRDVMRGLGGDLIWLLPVPLAWAGVLCVSAARGGRVSVLRTLADVATLLLIFAAVHIFFVQRVILERNMRIEVLSNFVAQSYRYAHGGGAVGALLAWPLYRYLGVAGGFIAALLAILLCQTAAGRVSRLIGWLGDRAAARPEADDFDLPEPEPAPVRAPATRTRRRETARDPFSEGVLGAQAPARRTARPAREAAAAAPARRRRPEPAAEAVRPVHAEAAPARRRKKLYVENMETAPAAQAERPAQPRKRGRSGDVGFATRDFDDFDMLDAESILQDKLDADEERAFKPDRSAAVEEARKSRSDVAQTPRRANSDALEVRQPAREREIVDLPDEELRIEPQAYEKPDEEEAPFDIPSRQRAKKGELPVINHDEMKVMVEEDDPEYNYPPIDLLQPGEAEDVSKHARRDREKAQLLEDTLSSFGITAKLTGIAHGPAVTRFELQPAPGIKVSRITSLSDDIALNLAAMSVRIEAPIPGKAAVGVEIPNDKVEMVRLRDVLESQEARKHPSKIAVGLGKDNSGRYIVTDIAKMPHVLIAGQTGSGKSVCINAIIASILFRAAPDEVRLILIDPKVVELSIYNNIPHLVCPVVTDPKKAASALDWAVAEMTRRYKQFAERGVRDIKGYNKSLQPGEKIMPQMVIIIDELADLMMVSPGEVEDSICRIAQLARACGMHLVIATQRPSVNVITGIIKANIPTRIAFSVASQVDSRTMIDHGGAEKLLGNGDMLFVPNGMKSMRVQGAWVSDEEVHAIVEYIKQSGEATYDPDMIEHMENATKSDAEKEEMSDEFDPKLPEAVDIVLELGQASISMLQRRMRIGYARAGRLIDDMARRGIVSEADGAKPRTVLITREEAQLMFSEDQSA